MTPWPEIAKSVVTWCKEGGGEGIRVRSRATIARNDVACLKQGCCRRAVHGGRDTNGRAREREKRPGFPDTFHFLPPVRFLSLCLT